MRIALHDYSGHPFPIQLSRELAGRGHHVVHLHCPSYVTGKGALERRPQDPTSLEIVSVPLAQQFAKHSPWKRPLQECEYARRLGARIEAVRPELVVSGNTPLFSQGLLLRRCRRGGIPFVFWLQDITAIAIERHLRRRLAIVGAALGRAVVHYERRLLRLSDAVVAISDDFQQTVAEWGVPPERLYVIENWSPLDDLPPAPRANEWAREHGLDGGAVVLYSGTLGLKHDPRLLLDLARRLRRRPGARLVVVSYGSGAEWLSRAAEAEGLGNVALLPFQPLERFAEVLATADILVAILEADAGAFSVPSKILSYHAGGRPIVAALPRENLASRIIERARSGVVVEPGDTAGLGEAVERLLDDARERARLGANARRYAEESFDIGRIADRFEVAFAAAVTRRGAVPEQ